MVNSERCSGAHFSELSPRDVKEYDISDEGDSDVTEETESGDSGDTSI